MASISPIVNLVHSTTRHLTPTPHRMPSAAWTLLTAASKVHWYWKMWNKADTYTKSANFGDLIKGHGLNWLAGDKLILKVAAHAIIISKTILTCVEQQRSLHESCQEFMSSLRGEYSIRKTYKWTIEPSTTFFSPSTINWWKSNKDLIVGRVNRIALSALRLCSDLLKLFMCMMDTLDAFSLNPQKRGDDIKEMFVNYEYCYEQLVGNRSLLLNELANNRSLIEQVLTGMGSSYKFEELTSSVKDMGGIMEKVSSVTNVRNGLLKKVGKHVICGLASGFNLSQYVPVELYPEEEPRVTPKKEMSPIRSISYAQPIEPVSSKIDSMEPSLFENIISIFA